jgi:hypothetical protein
MCCRDWVRPGGGHVVEGRRVDIRHVLTTANLRIDAIGGRRSAVPQGIHHQLVGNWVDGAEEVVLIDARGAGVLEPGCWRCALCR